MPVTTIATKSFVAVLLLLCADVAYAQAFPSKPIRLVTTEPGGGSDFAARLLVPGITASLGQQLIVDNRGVGFVPASAVAKSPPDGYTLLVIGSGLWILPYLRDNAPYDPVQDFSPISLISRTLNLLVVHPSLPVKSVKELIALARAKPGELNFATSGVGGASHLAGELFKSMSGVNIVRVNYKGSGPGLIALMSGEVQLSFPLAATTIVHVKSGKLRALAVTSAQPSVLLPEIPTIAAAGLPGYESVAMTGIFAPAKTPGAIINRLNQEIVRDLNRSEVKEQFLAVGAEVAANSPEQFADAIKADMARMGKVIRDAGIRER